MQISDVTDSSMTSAVDVKSTAINSSNTAPLESPHDKEVGDIVDGGMSGSGDGGSLKVIPSSMQLVTLHKISLSFLLAVQFQAFALRFEGFF